MTVIPTREHIPQIVRAVPGGQRRAAAPAEAEGGLSGRDVMRILRKRKWLIIISLVTSIALSIASTLLWLRFAPLYSSMALLEVRPQLPSALQAQRVDYTQDIIDSIARTSSNLIKSGKVLQMAIESDRVRNTNWYQKDRDNAIKRLTDEIAVAPVANTKLVRIEMTGTNKRELPEIVNAVAEAAVIDSRDSANLGKQNQVRQLQAERADLVERKDRVLAEKAKLLQEADVPNMLERTNVLTTQLHDLASQVRLLEVELNQAETSIKMLKAQIETGQIRSRPMVLQALDLDPSLRGLRSSLLNMRTERENLKRKFGPLHRSVQNFESRLKSVEDQVKQREDVLVEAQVGAMMSTAEAQRQFMLERLTKTRDQYRFVDVSIRGLQARLSRYQQLEDQDKDLSASITRIDSRMVDLRILLKGDVPLDLRRSAPTPIEPSMPKWAIMLPLGVLLGLMAGFGLTFMLEFIDTSIKGPGDIARRVDLPLLGMIPHEDDLEEEVPDLRLAFATHPNSLISEAFRQIRTCLLFSGPASQRRTLLITSPMAEDGRTTVAMNLAASIARGGRKVLVVDANFRQPAIRQLFPQCPEAGLSSALVGQGNWQEMVLEVEPNLHVMASGPLPPNPAELLGSDQMSGTISDMLTRYDQVIFDAAPALLVTDAAALSTLVDGVLLVVRAGANTYGVVTRAREMLTRIGAHMVGVVLNGVRTVAGGYLRKNYDAFYEYQAQAKLPGR